MNPELAQPPRLDNLSSLRAGRRELAAYTSEQQLRSVYAHDRVVNPDAEISRVENDDFDRYCPSLTATNLMGYEAIGLQVSDIISAVRKAPVGAPAQPVRSLELGQEKLVVYAHDGAMKLRFSLAGVESKPGNTATPARIGALVNTRFAQSPAHQAKARANAQLQQSAETPHELTMNSFDPTIDPLGSLAFLENIGLLTDLKPQFMSGTTATSLLASALSSIPGYRAQRTETPEAQTLTWGDGIVQTLRVDRVTGQYSFSVAQNSDRNYLERGNQSAEQATPFIETACARELCQLLDTAGLMFHPTIQANMMSMKAADRYGSIYTQLSREVAKWINKPERMQLSKLFVPIEAEYYGSAMIDYTIRNRAFPIAQYEFELASGDPADTDAKSRREAEIRRQWATVPHSANSESATVLLDLIDDALSRDTSTEQPTDLPVTQSLFSIQGGACFDVVSYYIGAASNSSVLPDKLRTVTKAEVTLLEKTEGAHTFLTTHEMTFNGVRLPKGALFIQNPDGWAFLRLTMFTFDALEDQNAVAGSELAKTLKNEAAALRSIGGTTLTHLKIAAR